MIRGLEMRHGNSRSNPDWALVCLKMLLNQQMSRMTSFYSYVSLLPRLTFDAQSNAQCVISPAKSALRKEKTFKCCRLRFQCDGIVLSERKKDEERGALFLSGTTLAPGPAWLGKGDCESGCHGGEQENRGKERRMGEEKTRSLEMLVT